MSRIDFAEFQEPLGIEDAEDRIIILQGDIHDIGGQLKDPARRAHFVDLSDDQYNNWRFRAEDAIKHKKAEVKFLEVWIARLHRSAVSRLASEDVTAGGLLLASLPILNIAMEGGDLSPTDQSVVKAVRGYIQVAIPSMGGLVSGTMLEEAHLVEH